MTVELLKTPPPNVTIYGQWWEPGVFEESEYKDTGAVPAPWANTKKPIYFIILKNLIRGYVWIGPLRIVQIKETLWKGDWFPNCAVSESKISKNVCLKRSARLGTVFIYEENQ